MTQYCSVVSKSRSNSQPAISTHKTVLKSELKSHLFDLAHNIRWCATAISEAMTSSQDRNVYYYYHYCSCYQLKLLCAVTELVSSWTIIATLLPSSQVSLGGMTPSQQACSEDQLSKSEQQQQHWRWTESNWVDLGLCCNKVKRMIVAKASENVFSVEMLLLMNVSNETQQLAPLRECDTNLSDSRQTHDSHSHHLTASQLCVSATQGHYLLFQLMLILPLQPSVQCIIFILQTEICYKDRMSQEQEWWTLTRRWNGCLK